MKYYLDHNYCILASQKNITYLDVKLLLEMQIITGTESLDTKGTA